jgi:acetyl esterase/lipase
VMAGFDPDGPGTSLLEGLLSQPRVNLAHRLGDGLLVEAELLRDGRPDPVPFILGYFARSDADPVLEHAYAGASWVTVLDEESYLFLSDRRDGLQQNQGHVGRSLWRHWRESGRRPELLLSAAGGIVSYAAAAGTVIASVWGAAEAASDRGGRGARMPDGQTGTLVRGDLWPTSSYQANGHVLRLLQVRLDPGPAVPTLMNVRGPRLELLDKLEEQLDQDVLLTGELALTPDGRRCAAGLVRFLRGGHVRYGMLMFPLADPESARAVWVPDDDLVQPIAAPDGSWFACTAERIAVPGLAPRQEVVLVATDGSRIQRAAGRHDDWLAPRAWPAADILLCVGERDGQRRLWLVRPGSARAELIEIDGSVLAVTATAEEALVVRSAIDLPPEVIALPLDPLRRQNADRGRSVAPYLLAAPARRAAPNGRMERLTYRAPDGSLWRSWLCLPERTAHDALPVLVWCHGGPLLSWTDWSWRWNPWPFVAEGYAVLMPDPPLSVGYGQDALERGWGRWTSEVATVAAAQVMDALTSPNLDSRRIAVMGGSFGGYLALALGTLLPAVRLIVSHAGWVDFAAVARVCDLHWHWLREYGPVDHSPSYRRESLSLDAIDLGVSVLLSHGCDDRHVPVGEARAIYRSLDTRGMDVQLMLFPSEGHSIRKPVNVAAWYRWVLSACNDALRPQSARKELSPR